MVSSHSPTAPTGPKSPKDAGFVAYDFDGTLTWTDSLFLFFRLWCGPKLWSAIGGALLGGGANRDQIKARLTRKAFAGADAGEFAAASRWYGLEVLPKLLRADAIEAVKRDLAGPLPVLIISASFEDYLIPFGEELSFSAVLATRLVRKDDRLTGEILGPNCRGPEKVRRFEDFAGPSARLVRAFGDTNGDRELLARSEQSHYRLFQAQPSRQERAQILAFARSGFARARMPV